jgi:hypothetical protein
VTLTDKEIEDKIRKTANGYARLVVLDTQREFTDAILATSSEIPGSAGVALEATNWINQFAIELLNRFK